MSKVIGIIGTRSRDSQEDYEQVENAFLEVYEEGDTICSGLCPRGGDRFAVLLSEKHNTPVIWYPANWKKYGKAAGIIRNTDVAKTSDVLIACVSKFRTGGTEDTIKKFIKDKGSSNKLILCKVKEDDDSIKHFFVSE